MTPEQIAKIQARADAATEGPFVLARYDHGGGRMFAQAANGQRGPLILDSFKEGDREFYAHARTDVPALLALVREQQARIERVEAVHEPKSWTKYGIPCFDEFDSPTARINGCTCGNEHYPCPTIAALTAKDVA